MGNPLFDQQVDEPSSDSSPASTNWDERIRAELRKGEKVVWVGQPGPRYFTRPVVLFLAFGTLWTTFSIFFLVMLALGKVHPEGRPGEPAPSWNWVVILFFVMIGLAFLSAPYWVRKRAKNTRYVLTNQRAVLWIAGWMRNVEVRSYEPADLTKIYRAEYPGGGDLVFEERVAIEQDGQVQSRYGFMGIDDVRAVEQLLRRTLLTKAE